METIDEVKFDLSNLYVDWTSDDHISLFIDWCVPQYNEAPYSFMDLLHQKLDSFIVQIIAKKLLPYAECGLPAFRVVYDDSAIYRNRNLDEMRALAGTAATYDDDDDIIEWLKSTWDLLYCDDCEDLEFNVRFESDRHDNNICRSCVDNRFTYSDYYDAYVRNNDLRNAIDSHGDEVEIDYRDCNFYYSNYRATYVHIDYEANEDEEQEEEPDYVIRSYHDSKSSQYLIPNEWSIKHNRYLGVELEVIDKNGMCEQAASRINQIVNLTPDDGVQKGYRMFFERDSSLGSHGFEMITQPMGLPMQRDIWSFLKDKNTVRGLISHKTSSCGLHVHVSKAGMSKLQIAKIVSFINAPEHESFIRAIARRYNEGYCKIKQKKMGSSADSGDRYEAVNITSYKTIEFRLFRGSLKYESVIAAIEFCNALVEFAKSTKTSIQDNTPDKFMEFMETSIPEETAIARAYIKNNLESE